MGNPMIGRRPAPPEPAVEAPPAPVADVVEQPVPPAMPPPATVAEAQTITGLNMGDDFEFEGPLIHDKVPTPPKYILAKLTRLDRTWRWMSVPHVRKAGMRQYVAYSPDADDRRRIDAGDCPPGVHVDEENKVRWGEDAFLASIPRRYFEMRQAERRRLTDQQTKLSKSRDSLADKADRAGIKLNLSVSESRGRTVPDPDDD